MAAFLPAAGGGRGGGDGVRVFLGGHGVHVVESNHREEETKTRRGSESPAHTIIYRPRC